MIGSLGHSSNPNVNTYQYGFRLVLVVYRSSSLRVAELAKSFGVSRCWPKALAASATVHPKAKLR
jgi:hypothetical protein